MTGAELGARVVRQDRLQRHLLLRRAEEEPGAEVPRRGRSGDPQDLREARHSAARAGDPGRRRAAATGSPSMRCSTPSRWPRPSRRSSTKAGVIFMPISEAIREYPGPRAPVSRHRRAGHRQLLRDAELGGLHRRVLRLHPAGRALPDGAVDLFPHQREEHRPVRAHADHRRQGLLRVATSRAARPRSATRTSSTRRWSS